VAVHDQLISSRLRLSVSCLLTGKSWVPLLSQEMHESHCRNLWKRFPKKN
jgi:hypothetical protein